MIENGLLPADRMSLEVLSPENEARDNVAGLYSNSLLLLISRALETRRNETLLGLPA